MAFHLIVTCVAQKNAPKSHSILDSKIKSGTAEMVYEQWKSILHNSDLKKYKAKELYSGGLWGVFLDSWGIINNRIKDAKLWVLSAGYGLINAEDNITPYNITFQESKLGIPSVLRKIEYTSRANAKTNTLQEWWKLLSQKDKNPNNIQNLFSGFGNDDHALVVLSKDYLDAVFKDLSKGIKNTKHPKNISVICNNVNDSVAKRLGSNWLFASNNFINLPKTNSTFINGKIAHQLLVEMFNNQNGLKWWLHDNFNMFLKNLSESLPKPKKISRKPSTDKEIKKYIHDHLTKISTSFTKLHRSYRDSGRACEYSRFKGLFAQIKEQIKKENLKKRPDMPVTHTPRKTKMLFFLPDWDDRVDPLFNFDTDEAFPNRDPYEHDAYHYEIYGHLNCDGILVSRSVLEENKGKIKKIRNVGIHNYLRLPSNVPVLGDCGAFNYIMQENPPYETGNILNFYQDLGFNYGVSIDHLIVPGVLKHKRYHKFIENHTWKEIDQEEFKKLGIDPKTKIVNSLRLTKQLDLFEHKNTICEETYIDADERDRRYQITIKNAQDFLKAHRDGRYTFKPIGAAQGWDPDSYAKSVLAYQDMGYEFIALGGLARSNNKEVLSVLETVNKVRDKNTKIHMFGVARIDLIEKFLEYGVYSADSAGMLRQAWLSSANNFHVPNGNHYTAIRVPLTDNKKTVKKAMAEHDLTFEEIVNSEQLCLNALKKYDQGKQDYESTMESLLSYGHIMGVRAKFANDYKRTLSEKPWKNCPCKICKKSGIQVAIFRRNNRNRRRGFHNTWVFFKKFKELTDIA